MLHFGSVNALVLSVEMSMVDGLLCILLIEIP